ncbi:MAG: ABC-F type ribosomal protection protein [Campylobacteraceae bacterium]|jgi:lincosamide and streptogramin A transport system ATP-binding/permease protein|nr:ABC-F type ribosomal protection protein [Campylobacteraceae bacterium]
MSLINIKNLSFTYENGSDAIFENVSITLDTDWKLGFISRNGRGKTTLLKLLMGQYEYTGTISASVNFDYFPFEVNEPEKTVLEIAQKIYPFIELWQLEKEISLLSLNKNVLHRAFETLSGGEQAKSLLAILFLKEDNFLLLDEPANHLDTQAVQNISEYLKYKKGFILVSHDRYFLDNCVDHILSINQTGLEMQYGNFSSWQQNKEYKDNFELSQNKKLSKDIKRLQAAAKDIIAWSNKTERSKYHIDKNSGVAADKGFIGHKSAKLMQKAKNAQNCFNKAADEKSKLLKNLEYAPDLKLSFLEYSQKRLIEAVNLSPFYDKTVFEKLSFTIENGERVLLKGQNGCGKSTLIKLILGENIAYDGKLYVQSNLKISYVPQTIALEGNLKDFANISKIDESLFKTILRKLDFSREQFEKDMSEFSDGQKKKVLVAKSLCESAHIYVWDEPLNFIDVLSRMQIENMLLEYRPTMLFVEHDKVFAEKIATKIIEL